MDRHYRLGLLVVLTTLLASSAICTAVGVLSRAPARASQNLGERGLPLGPFHLVERSGQSVSDADLAGRVWIASFIFTRCPLSCPRITSTMKSLQSRLEGLPVQLVSISVDPEHDTPEVLEAYARKFDADPHRWWFLTGPPEAVRTLVTGGFKLGLSTAGEPERAAGAEAFTHSDRIALVGPGNRVAGYFQSTEGRDLDALVRQARDLAPGSAQVPSWVRRLPAVNASLNGTASVLLILAWILIRRGLWRGHATCMTLALIASALFLGCYLVYHFEVRGSVPFRGEGPIRLVYYSILLSHVVLAVVIVPLVPLSASRAYRRRFDQHARLAKVTFPIWLYVSVTGVLIYLMLYQLPVPGST